MFTELKLAAILGALAAGLLGLHLWIKSIEARGAAKVTAAVQAQAASAAEAARIEGDRRDAAQREIDSETQRMATRARASLAAAPSLRDPAIIAFNRACPANPSASGVEQTTAEPARVLADVFGELERRAKLYAETADGRGFAGSGCVKSYETLTP